MRGSKTLLDYLLEGGIKGKFFKNEVYDPQNPVYRVDNIRLLGDGSEQTTTVIDAIQYPEGYVASSKIDLRLKDPEATPEEMERHVVNVSPVEA